MATYFPSSSNKNDEVPAIYERDPAGDSYSEGPGLSINMMMYMNQSSTSTSYTDALAENSQLTQLPSVGATDLNPSQHGILSSIVGSQVGDQAYNVWRDGRNEMLFMQAIGSSSSMQPMTTEVSDTIVRSFHIEDAHMGLQTQQGMQHSRQNFQGQGLSLSLSSSITPSSLAGSKHMQSDISSYSSPGFSSTISSSKYLKAAQELLDEVVNVQKALKQNEPNKHQSFQQFGVNISKETDRRSNNVGALPSAPRAPSNLQELGTNTNSDVSPAERQDMQNKMSKLISMLDEVDIRYRQYHHHMQIVVSSFDLIAGPGSSKTYTALALQVISHHFRCLRDTINGQIKSTRKNLGDQDSSAYGTGVGISRLRLVDQQLRQQRNLQHLGMMQQHTWRPQRGLPESSVSILRAWLFEHFLHPYPKDSDKLMLARQTGLTRSQVSNWFINARVRLWKPMVEEMYKEETHDTEIKSHSSPNNATRAPRDEFSVPADRGEGLLQSPKSAATGSYHPSQFQVSQTDSDPDVNMSGAGVEAVFQNRTYREDDTDYMGIKLREEEIRPNMDNCGILQETFNQSEGSSSRRFMTSGTAYQMSELGRSGSGGVSLTLGLQHCDRDGLPMSNKSRQNVFPIRGDEMYNAGTSSMGTDTGDHDCASAGNLQHRFGSSHLLHDYVP